MEAEKGVKPSSAPKAPPSHRDISSGELSLATTLCGTDPKGPSVGSAGQSERKTGLTFSIRKSRKKENE